MEVSTRLHCSEVGQGDEEWHTSLLTTNVFLFLLEHLIYSSPWKTSETLLSAECLKFQGRGRDSEEVWFAQGRSQGSQRGSPRFSFLLSKMGFTVVPPCTVNPCITRLQQCLAHSNISVKFTFYYLLHNETDCTLRKCYPCIMLTPYLWKDEVLWFEKLMLLKWTRPWFIPSANRLEHLRPDCWCRYNGELGIMANKVEGDPPFMGPTAG